MNEVSEMGEAPLGRLLWKFSLPSIAVMLVNGLYNFIDRIFIGQGMGTEALAAVTAGFPVMLLAQGIGSLLNAGAGTLISIAVGAGKREEAESTLGQAFSAALLAAVPVMALSWIFMDPILRLFGTTESIMPLARTFIGIVTLGFGFQIISMAIANSLRSQNRPRSAMLATVSGTGLNAILAPLFIFAFGWGIAGAASATVIAQVLSCALMLAFVQDKSSLLRIRRRELRPRPAVLASIAKLGCPLFLVNLLGLGALLAANNAMSRLGGETALAALGIINTLNQLLAFPIIGITQGATALWGYNYGAGRIDRVRRLTGLVAAWTTGIGILATAAVELFPRAFISVFNASDQALVEIGSRGAAVYMMGFFAFGAQATTASFFIAIGKATKGGILYAMRQSFLVAALAFLPLAMGIEGVYWSGPLTDFVCAAVAALLLARGVRSLAPGAGGETTRPGSWRSARG